MWVIPTLTPEFIEQMEEVLELYAKPYDPLEPVLCFDEKSKQLLQDTRPLLPMHEGKLRRRDYEYKRNGTRNIFLTVEPKGGYRTVQATKQRKKPDFANEMKRIINLPRYRNAKRIHLVLDNLNTHFETSLVETLGVGTAKRMMRTLCFHHTPKHASWLNMAEIELSIMGKQAINQRIPDEISLQRHLAAWQTRRNLHHMKINWRFTKQEARVKFKYQYND